MYLSLSDRCAGTACGQGCEGVRWVGGWGGGQEQQDLQDGQNMAVTEGYMEQHCRVLAGACRRG